ncbi:MAG: DsbA family protein [Saprospiraceae bacterium]|nr:DsbA family protein [Saprospiraceae bacterium]
MQLVYFVDPLCSWCYGFGPELTKVVAALPDAELQLVMGGLRPEGTEVIADMKDFLKEHWDHVQQRSGQPFSYKILEDPDFVYNTEPPCRAVVVVRHMDRKKEFDFLKALQMAFYYGNRPVTQLGELLSVVQAHDLNQDTFTSLFESDEFRSKTLQDFQYSAQLGVRGFPTLLLKVEDRLETLCIGFQESEKILRRLENLLTEAE